ncbi:pupal cuticle protein C1B-like [Toxorhynchites rutilus septentrionalis]|uniref:pupal cuticle protein C1B-like n=1 Tax=Toxorhynchites rutilus septentrionalis TaxID=329112 RepID=UPI00247A0ABE|nr:pupal cuticle protein C1B-like [Toxorhynchites rutilus septentrionalis]
MFRFVVLLAAVAVCQAAYSLNPAGPTYAGIHTPAITSQQSNILRSFGNLGQISTHSKTIDTPYSTSSKSDVRISNPGLAVGHVAAAYPGYHAAAAYPAYHAPAAYAPAVYGAPAVKAVAAAPALLGVAYSAAPAVAHMSYNNGLGISYAW